MCGEVQCAVWSRREHAGEMSQSQAIAELVGYGAEPRAWNESNTELLKHCNQEAAFDEMCILERLE